jgi:hypothetical protein
VCRTDYARQTATLSSPKSADRDENCDDHHTSPLAHRAAEQQNANQAAFVSCFISQESDGTMMLSYENRGCGLIRAHIDLTSGDGQTGSWRISETVRASAVISAVARRFLTTAAGPALRSGDSPSRGLDHDPNHHILSVANSGGKQDERRGGDEVMDCMTNRTADRSANIYPKRGRSRVE